MRLYMTELSVSDWPRCVAWYRDVLGLDILLLDEDRRFALLGGEGGRLALKEGTPSSDVRLSFEVTDLEASRNRMERTGSAPTAIVEDDVELFRWFRLVDPQGVHIQVFAFVHGPHTATNGIT